VNEYKGWNDFRLQDHNQGCATHLSFTDIRRRQSRRMSFCSFSTFLLLALTCRSSFAEMIGPVADLVISAAEVSPDGFNRTATLAGGTVIGPVVSGNKVRLSYFLPLFRPELNVANCYPGR
jgi:hypothetical protein